MEDGHSINRISPRYAGLVETWRAFSRTKFYDLLAAAPVILWYGLSARHMIPAFAAKLRGADWNMADIQFVVSLLAQGAGIVLIATATVFLVLRRPPKAKAKGFLPRFAAFAGTYLGVAVVWLPPQTMSVPLSLASLGLILAGSGFAVFALVHLGRSFSLMAEARRLVTNGPYAVLRHPLYLGEAVSMIGLTLQYLSPLAIVIAGLQICFQLVRMRNEEAVLAGMFPEYGAYAARTARLVPGVY